MFSIPTIDLCKFSVGLKVRNFQLYTEPIRLFLIQIFHKFVKYDLMVLQRRTEV